MDYTVRGILQVRILEWVAFPFSRGIFPTQGLNPRLWHCRQILYQLSHKASLPYWNLLAANLHRMWMCICSHVRLWELEHVSDTHCPVRASSSKWERSCVVYCAVTGSVGRHANPLQYPCLENPMDRGAWWGQFMGQQTVGHNWATNTQTHRHRHTHTMCRVSLFQATSPLDYKEVKPVHPKGNLSWIFIGRTDAEAETPVLWPPDAKSWLTGKDPDAGKHWRWEEKGATVDEMVGWHHRLDGHEFEQALGVGDGQGGLACCSPWSQKSWTWLSDWTELNSCV